MSLAKVSLGLLEPGQVLAGALIAVPVAVSTQSPTGTPVADRDLCQFLLLSQERQLCVSFLPKGMLCHNLPLLSLCDLNLQP